MEVNGGGGGRRRGWIERSEEMICGINDNAPRQSLIVTYTTCSWCRLPAAGCRPHDQDRASLGSFFIFSSKKWQKYDCIVQHWGRAKRSERNKFFPSSNDDRKGTKNKAFMCWRSKRHRNKSAQDGRKYVHTFASPELCPLAGGDAWLLDSVPVIGYKYKAMPFRWEW
jgi:hypothetical protein